MRSVFDLTAAMQSPWSSWTRTRNLRVVPQRHEERPLLSVFHTERTPRPCSSFSVRARAQFRNVLDARFVNVLECGHGRQSSPVGVSAEEVVEEGGARAESDGTERSALGLRRALGFGGSRSRAVALLHGLEFLDGHACLARGRDFFGSDEFVVEVAELGEEGEAVVAVLVVAADRVPIKVEHAEGLERAEDVDGAQARDLVVPEGEALELRAGAQPLEFADLVPVEREVRQTREGGETLDLRDPVEGQVCATRQWGASEARA